MGGIINNDHFLLGLGLAAGPAIILCFVIFAFFKWGKSWRKLITSNSNPDTCMQHAGLIRDNAFVIDECKSIWLEIKEINNRQMSLRQKLPENYVSKNDLMGIQDRLKSIDQKLDRYMEFAIANNLL